MPNSLVTMNDQQYAAVTSESKTIRCLAGAGSGKTRVLTGRMAYLHNEKRVGTSNMLALTFTRLAAKEMKERLGNLISPQETRKLFVGTFHSFCVKVLREWGHLVEVEPNFTIYDEEDRRALLQTIIEDFSAKKIKIDDILSNMQIWDKAWPEDDLGRVAHEYYYRLRQHNALDLDLLLHRASDLLDIDQVQDYYRNIYRYVFVDEFQDTSNSQTSIITKLSPEYLFVVGDDFQSIYGWRGANPSTLIHFGPVGGFPEADTVKLEINYRSTKPIVDAANRLIAHNVNQTEKTLVTSREGNPIICEAFPDEDYEMQWVAGTILSTSLVIRRESLSDIAILARTNKQLERMKETLGRHGIPSQIVNAGGDIFKKPVVKGVLNFIAAASNPLDNITVKKAFNFPEPRSTDLQMQKWELEALEDDIPLMDILARKILDNRRVLEFIRDIGDMEHFFSYADHDADFVFENAIQCLGLPEYFEERGLSNRLEDLEEAKKQISKWQEIQESLGDSISYEHFLRWLRTKDIQERLLQEEQDAVKLLTVHAAKGLEFPVVFIIGMNQGVFPSKRSEDLEEERRLFYVAITRAKERLIVTRAQERVVWGNHTEVTEPSQFLEESGFSEDAHAAAGYGGEKE